MKPQPTTNYISREGWFSIVGNLILFVLKFWIGTISGSIALIADAWHTLSDSISSVIVLVGGKLSRKPADKEHPFGHGRAEHIAAVIIGVLLAIVAFDFLVDAYQKLRSGQPGHFGWAAISITVVSILAKELMARYAFYASQKANSPILKADGWHHRTDSLSSVIILVGIITGNHFWWTDGALAIIVALMIAYASYKILAQEIKSLLGEEVDPAIIKSIKKEVYQLMDEEVYIHHFHLHDYGAHRELSCHIKLPADLTLMEAHAICSEIEKMILNQFEMVATIHPEPLIPSIHTTKFTEDNKKQTDY